LIFVLGALAIVYPPAIACLCVIAYNFQTPGITQAFVNYSRLPELCFAGICFLAVYKAVRSIKRGNRAAVTANRAYILSIVAIAVFVWMNISLYLGGGGLVGALRSSLQSGVLGVVFAAAYYNDRLAKSLFVFTVGAHLLLAFILVTFPGGPLSLFGAENVASIDPTDVGILATGIGKASGQFSNPVQLSLYGAIGIVLGVYLLAYKRGWLARIAGMGVLLLGMWASYVTVERAVWIGCIIGLFTLLLPLTAKSWGRAVYVGLIYAVLSLVCVAMVSDSSTAMGSLTSHFSDMVNNKYRVSAAEGSVDILFYQPIFGKSGDVQEVVDVVGGAPHQSFYFFAVVYGIPAGIGVLVMTWWVFASKLPRRMILAGRDFTRYDRYLAHAIGWVVLLLALSNNMSAGMLGWICLGYACVPWAYSSPVRKRARSFARGPLVSRKRVGTLGP
jgi:hypothetical protein